MKSHWRGLAIGIWLALCVALGGATRSGYLVDAILQFLAIGVLAWIVPLRVDGYTSGLRSAGIVIAGLGTAISALYLLPLPPLPALATASTELARDILAAIGRPGDLPGLGATPSGTVLAALSALPALATFAAVSALDPRNRATAGLCLLAMVILSVFVGLLQVAQGPTSGLRLYDVTNTTDAVGFFANRNHFAALIYVAVLLVCARWLGAIGRFLEAPSARRTAPDIALPLLAGFACLLVLVATQTFTRSRAGLGLTMLALLAAVLLGLRARHGTVATKTGASLIAATGIAGSLFVIQFTLYRFLERFAGDPLVDARIPFARNTWEAALAHLPLGAGPGSFRQVYGLFEHPTDTLLDTFANRAHNDPLEWLLETGVPGVILAAAFLVWLGVATLKVWRRSVGMDPDAVRMARAASLAIVLLLLHSLVDYPLRTTALMVVFAFCCALLVPAAASEHAASEPRLAQVRTPAMPAPPRPSAPTRPSTTAWPQSAMPHSASTAKVPGTAAAFPGAGRPWGDDIEWPSEWRPERATGQSKPKRPGGGTDT